MKEMTFNIFCEVVLDRMYEPRLPQSSQCTGYLQLKNMVVQGISPATKEEITRWETKPIMEELISVPDIKYLRFLHTNLRGYIIDNWETIKTLEITD